MTGKATHSLAQTNLVVVADLPSAALPHGDQGKLEAAMLLAMEPLR